MDSLFEIISTLSQSEKRYFRLHASFMFDGEDKSYIKLFDIISAQNEYDEEIIKKKFGHKFFAQEKRHLFTKLMESLRAYHSKENIGFVIDSCLAEFKILLNKSVLKQARKVLHKAESLALKYESFADLMRVRQMETELLVAEGDIQSLTGHFNKLRKELPHLIKLLDNKLLIEKEYILFIKLNQESELVRSNKELQHLKSGMDAGLLSKETNALSLTARLQFCYIKGLFHYLSGEFMESLSWFEKQLNGYSVNQLLAQEQESEYVKCMANVLLLYSITNANDKFENLYKTFRDLKPSHGLIEDTWVYRTYLLKLNRLVNKSKFNDALNWIKENDSGIEDMEKKFEEKGLVITERNFVMFDTVRTYMGLKEYKKALKYLNNYLNSSSDSVKTDSYTLSRIIALFIHLELENHDLIEYNLRSLKRYLKDRKRMFGFEKSCIAFLEEILKVDDKKEKKKQWKKFYLCLQELKEDVYERNAMHSFDLLEWVEEKLKHDFK